MTTDAPRPFQEHRRISWQTFISEKLRMIRQPHYSHRQAYRSSGRPRGPRGDASESTTQTLDPLPDFDRSFITRNICILGLVITWIASIASIIAGSKIIAKSRSTGGVAISSSKATSFTQIGFPLLFDIGVAFSTECMGFIHTASLRWGRFREGCLEFNSNLRLCSVGSGPNGPFFNIVSMILLIMTYCASSQVFPLYADMEFDLIDGHTVITYQHSPLYPGLVNGLALTALGGGLLVLAFITTWSLASMVGKIHTWSSNPLNNTFAALHVTLAGRERNDVLDRTPGYSRRSQRQQLAQSSRIRIGKPGRLQRKQRSALGSNLSILTILIFVWILGLLTFVWAILVWHMGARGAANTKSFFEGAKGTADMSMLLANSAYPSTTAGYFISCTVQALYTIGLHLVELLVNFSRDEDVWRKAAPSSTKGSCQGARLRGDSIVAAISSWQTLLLFAFKPTVHWLFGLSMSFMEVGYDGKPWFGSVLSFRATPTFVLAGIWILLSIFATVLALMRPRGYQPAAWGRIPLLEKLVDDWGVPGEEETTRLFWGDKGVQNGARKAGTSSNKDQIGHIQTSGLYCIPESY